MGWPTFAGPTLTTMSRRHSDPARPFWVEGYYGPGGRKGTKKLPNKGRVGEREGDLAIATVHSDEFGQTTEIQILEAREDIGEINYGRNG